MSKDKKIYKPGPVRGFPEWLPEERIVEQRWLDHIRHVFESYGYCSIETPSVEELDVITAKGEVDKEIYVIERLHKDEDDKKEARLALHFDQTVPLARYVAQHFNDLVFPFKRYQMQRVWRGERPQMGRMREFTQCDIDIINVDNLPLSFDAEVASIMYEVLAGLNIGKVQLRISNRKIIAGILEIGGIHHPHQKTIMMRSLDKLEKIGRDAVIKEITNQFVEFDYREAISNKKGVAEVDLAVSCIVNFINFADTKFDNSSKLFEKANEFKRLFDEAKTNQSFNDGLNELAQVLDALSHLPFRSAVGDLTIVRGLDYYTGTVYETQLLDVPEFTGSVCSGGRYDDLAGSYINKHLPGVGISIGFSRLFDVMRQTRPDLLGIGPKGPADILMTVPEDEADRPLAYAAARTLRKRGIKVEMYHAPKKIGDQMKYAAKKNLPFVWFVRGGHHQVKDMTTQEQTDADPANWTRGA